MLQPYATHTVIFRMFFFSSIADYFRVIINTSTLSESPISVLFHGGMVSSAMTSQREESGEVSTRHNSADSVPTSNLVCITEVAIRTILCIAGIIYYTCNLITDSQCIRYRDAFNKRF